MNALFYVNWEKEHVRENISAWIDSACRHGFTPVFFRRERARVEAAACTLPVHYTDYPESGKIDIVLTFGGDGTMIRALDKYAGLGCPFLGVNFGRMGFLLEADADDADSALDAIARNHYYIEKRMMLQLLIGKERTRSVLAMNEVSISRGMSQRMIAMDVVCDQQIVEHYIADGVILSTPTGSTAYSLAAGGPIIMPDVECILINPICPHTLTSRPIILSKEKTVEVILNMREERKGSILSVDGETVCPLENGDRVTVMRAESSAQLVRFHMDDNFFTLIKDKLSMKTL